MKENDKLPIVLRHREKISASGFLRGRYDPVRSMSVFNGIPLVELAKPQTTITEAREGIDDSETRETYIRGQAFGMKLPEDGFVFGCTISTSTSEGIDQSEASEIASMSKSTDITRAEGGIDADEAPESLGLHQFDRTSITETFESIDQSEVIDDNFNSL